MSELRAVTLRQPYASLVQHGVKCLLDMDWSTDYRGRLLIHAAKREPEWAQWEEGPYDEIGDPDKRLFQYLRYDDRSWVLADCTPGTGVHDQWPLPLGAVVASCELLDVVEITTCGWPVVHDLGRALWRRAASTYNVSPDKRGPEHDGLWLCRWDGDHGEVDAYVTDELPFGDFTPGRVTWLLRDVRPTTYRCPRCWGDGFIDSDDGLMVHCPTCAGQPANACPPVPMRGRPGLWTPKPEDWTVAA